MKSNFEQLNFKMYGVKSTVEYRINNIDRGGNQKTLFTQNTPIQELINTKRKGEISKMSTTEKQQPSVLGILSSRKRKTKGKTTEVFELRGNPSLEEDGSIPHDEYGIPIISFDAVRVENNNQACRMAFKGKELIESIEEKAVVRGEDETAQILVRGTFKLKRADDVTYWVSKLHDFENSENSQN